MAKHPTVELTDEVRQDATEGPPAFLVFCPSMCAMCEYKVFADKRAAEHQVDLNSEMEPETHFSVYPLWAGWPTDS